MDRITTELRSHTMSRISSKNTKPELRVRSAAHALGLRFRIHRKDLPGKPDLIFPRHCVAILVHGCFWHRHTGCARASTPQTRIEFWAEKFARNVSRDRATVKELEELGWNVAVIWECETKDEQKLSKLISEIFQIDCA